MRKSTLTAVAIFVALLGLSAWVLTRKPERGIMRVSLAGVPVPQVDRIAVAGPQPIELKKDGSVWRLPNSREADGDMVQNLLTNTTHIVSSDVLTEDPNRAAEFEVDEAKGHRVKLFAGSQTAADFTVGKALAGGVAVKAGDVTYRVSNLFAGAFAHPANDWLQRRLFADKVDDIWRVNVQLHGEKPYTLTKGSKAWELADESKTDQAAPDFRFDPAAGQALAVAVLNLRAQDIVEPDPGAEITKLGPEADKVTLFLKDQAIQNQNDLKEVARTVLLGAAKMDKETEAGVYARVEGRSDLYLLPPYAASGIRKKLTDLRDLTLLVDFDINKVSTLVVNDGKKPLTFTREGQQWRLGKGEKAPAGFELDSTKVMRRVTAAARARALGLARVQVAKAAGTTPPKASVTMTLENKQSLTVAFGGPAAEQPNAVYAQGSDGKVYTIASYLRDTLVGGLDTFKKEAEVDPLAQLDPKTLANLPPDVRASLEQQIAQKRREQQIMKSMGKQGPATD